MSPTLLLFPLWAPYATPLYKLEMASKLANTVKLVLGCFLISCSRTYKFTTISSQMFYNVVQESNPLLYFILNSIINETQILVSAIAIIYS